MDTVDYIKGEIKKLYENNPNINISVKGTHSRLAANSVPAIITGVYSNVFCVQETLKKPQRTQTYQYADVLIGRVEISELDYFPSVNTKKQQNSPTVRSGLFYNNQKHIFTPTMEKLLKKR